MPGPRRRIAFLAWACFLTLQPTSAPADEFDRLGEADLSRPGIQKHARKQEGLNFRDLAALPAVLRDARSSLLIVVTDQGNVARLIASPGFRKVPGDPNKLTPTLVVDRFETRDPANRGAPLARGKDAWLFDGFGYDLDAGQVVPIELGADIQFVSARSGRRPSEPGRQVGAVRGRVALPRSESQPPIGRRKAAWCDRPITTANIAWRPTASGRGSSN